MNPSSGKIRVLYDYQAFAMQTYGGVSRYFSLLLNHLSTDISPCLTNFLGNNLHCENESIKGQLRTYLSDSVNNSVVVERINQLLSLNKVREQHWQVFHPTYYNPYFLKRINKRPFVITIHDMAHEFFPGSFPLYDQSVKWKKNLAGKAEHIITVSENSKDNIKRLLHVPDSKISVIHHGYKRLNREIPVIDHKILKKNYLLFVGKRHNYKNFNAFLHAVAPILKQEDVEIICAGNVPFTKVEKQLIQDLQVVGKVQHIKTNDTQLSFLYKHAIALVFPSKYEGFGMPVLEAFAHSCPVVTSNISALPEIAGNAALYFNPYEVEDIRSKCQQIINDKNLQSNLIEAGKNRLTQFSWQKAAQFTEDVYKKLI